MLNMSIEQSVHTSLLLLVHQQHRPNSIRCFILFYCILFAELSLLPHSQPLSLLLSIFLFFSLSWCVLLGSSITKQGLDDSTTLPYKYKNNY